MEKHLSLGGSDEAGEVLVSLLYRFAGDEKSQVSRACKTWISRDVPLYCAEGTADFSPCRHIDDFVEVFEEGWKRLAKCLATAEQNSFSILAELIRHQGLQQQRVDTLQYASNWRRYEKDAPANRQKQAAGRVSVSEKQSLRNLDRKRQPAPSTKAAAAAKPRVAVAPVDADEEALLRGYGVRRDAKGILIPRDPPGHVLEAKLEDKNAAFNFKNRKSKKKQHRDKGKKAIARELAGSR